MEKSFGAVAVRISFVIIIYSTPVRPPPSLRSSMMSTRPEPPPQLNYKAYPSLTRREQYNEHRHCCSHKERLLKGKANCDQFIHMMAVPLLLHFWPHNNYPIGFLLSNNRNICSQYSILHLQVTQLFFAY